MNTESEVNSAAVQLLSRRDYSESELRKKLLMRTESELLIDKAVARVQELGYQCDQRYTESYIRYAISQGKGSVWIDRTLSTKGIAKHVIDYCLSEVDVDWQALASRQLLRKFKLPPENAKDKARQFRYLASRGFSLAIVYKALELIEFDYQ